MAAFGHKQMSPTEPRPQSGNNSWEDKAVWKRRSTADLFLPFRSRLLSIRASQFFSAAIGNTFREISMRRVLSIVCSTALVAILTACAVYTPEGALVVDPGARAVSQQRGGFCPPGQAKKGNC